MERDETGRRRTENFWGDDTACLPAKPDRTQGIADTRASDISLERQSGNSILLSGSTGLVCNEGGSGAPRLKRARESIDSPSSVPIRSLSRSATRQLIQGSPDAPKKRRTSR